MIVVAVTSETKTDEPPIEAVAPPWKPVPVIVIDVPPPMGPVVGAMDATVGAGATYVKQPVHVPLCVSRFVTTTLTAPAARAVVVPVMLVPFTVSTVTAEPPSEAVAPVWNPVPPIVIDVPPAVGPLLGVIEATVGAGATYVKQPVHVALCASGFVTVTSTSPAW